MSRIFQQVLDPGWEMVRHVLSAFTAEEMQSTQLLEEIREKACQVRNLVRQWKK